MRRNYGRTFGILARVWYDRECVICGCGIRASYTHCYRCNQARKRAGWHEPENLPDIKQCDSHHARTFQVYVLHTDYGHYVGHTGNIKTRMCAHLADEVPSTAAGNPKKVWQSRPLKTRDDATRYEAALKSWRDNRNERFAKDTGVYPIPYQMPASGGGWWIILLAVLLMIFTFILLAPKVVPVVLPPS